MSETCWAYKKYNKIINGIYLVFYFSVTMSLEETGWEEVDWIDLAQNKDKWLVVVKAVMNFWIP